MQWHTLPRKLNTQSLQRFGSHHHDFTPTEMHALIGVGALAVVTAILALLALTFW